MAEVGEIKMIPVEQLVRMHDNANVMEDIDFNDLVQKIERRGFDQPLKVYWNEELKKYEIVKGNHRFEASRYLNYTELPCVIGQYSNRDEAVADSMSDNITRGAIDAEKFTKSYNALVEKYGTDNVEDMLMIKNKKALARLIKQVKDQLPPEMQKAFDEAKKDIKDIDDLAMVLQRLFSEFGHTVDYSFMFFNFGGNIHLMVKMEKRTKEQITKVTEWCEGNKVNINIVIQKALDLWMAENQLEIVPTMLTESPEPQGEQNG